MPLAWTDPPQGLQPWDAALNAILDQIKTWSVNPDVTQLLLKALRATPNPKSANYTAAFATDFYIPVTAGAGGVTLSLPAATGTGGMFIVKKLDSAAGLVTIAANGGDLIDGLSTLALSVQYQAAIVVDRASGLWDIVKVYIPPLSSTFGQTFTFPGTLAVTPGAPRWYPPKACTIVGVKAAVNTPSAGSAISVDVNKNGTTIFTGNISIAAGANTATGTLNGTQTLTVNDYLQVDVDAVGSTTPGSDLTVIVEYTEP